MDGFNKFRKLCKDSHDSTKTELDIFQPPLTQTSVEHSEVYELSPVRAPNGNENLEFQIAGNTEFYISLHESKIHLQAKITKGDGAALSATAEDVNITHTNNLLHSMFTNIKIYINNKLVESNANYEFKSFLSTMLNYGSDAKQTHLESSQWIGDGMLEEHTEQFSNAQKALMADRAKKLKGSPIIDMVGQPLTPLFQQNRYLIPGLNIRIEFERSDPKAVLQYCDKDKMDGEYNIEIVKVQLLIKRLRVHKSIAAAHARLLDQGKNALYPVNHTDCKFFTISPGRQEERLNIIQNKQEAKIILVGFISHLAKSGSLAHSPFKFENFGLTSVNLAVNGNNVESNPLDMSFENGTYTRVYDKLISVCGKSLTDTGNNITLQAFKDNLSLIAFDLTPDSCHGEGHHLIRNSTTSLDLRFAAPLADTVSVMVYYEYDDMLTVDKTRTIHRASES